MTTISQRYVSHELSHFVGRGRPEPDQYDVLVNKILKTGWITHGPHHDPSVPRGVSLDLSKPISTGELIKEQVVCFCDIPADDLEIHTSKYSKFGLSFKKDFLIAKGACPVFYVANENPVPVSEMFSPDDFLDRLKAARANNVADRALYFDTSVRAVLDLMAALDVIISDEPGRYFKGLSPADFKSRLQKLMGISESETMMLETTLRGNGQAAKTVRMIADFLLNYVFTYFKCFDAKRSMVDEHNYYMEREWRVANNVSFSLSDVSRVFFPQKYAAQFRADLPAYIGQVTFLD